MFDVCDVATVVSNVQRRIGLALFGIGVSQFTVDTPPALMMNVLFCGNVFSKKGKSRLRTAQTSSSVLGFALRFKSNMLLGGMSLHGQDLFRIRHQHGVFFFLCQAQAPKRGQHVCEQMAPGVGRQEGHG